MASFNWANLMRIWNDATGPELSDRGMLTEEENDSGWLGKEPASKDDIAQLESRLGIALPPSYSGFLKFSNGWGPLDVLTGRLFSAHQVGLLAELSPGWQAMEVAAEDRLFPEPMPDDKYFDYSDDFANTAFRLEHLRNAIQIGEEYDGAVLLLNPQVINADGEWEAWHLASWNPGVVRYPSLQEMMESWLERKVPGSREGSSMKGALPREFLGAPGSPDRREKKRILSTDGPPSESVLGVIHCGQSSLELFPRACNLTETDVQNDITPELNARMFGLRLLGARAVEAAKPSIIRIAESDEEHWIVRARAVEALSEIGGADAVECLVSLIGGPVTGHAIEALRKLDIGSLREPMLAELKQGEEIYRALSILEELDEPRVEPLCENFIADYKLSIYEIGNMIELLLRRGAVEAIDRLLRNTKPKVRMSTALRVIRTDQEGRLRVLVESMAEEDPDSSVRIAIKEEMEK